MASTREWRVRPSMPPEVGRALSSYPAILAQLLFNRGIRTAGEAEEFLSDRTASHDPFLLPGMERAVERLTKAMERGERTAVYGDFDVDGLSGAALLSRALGELGVPVTPYIPHRVEEGHGLSLRAVDFLAGSGVTLLITVDCGITSHMEVQAAAERGIDTIVTDHHLPPPKPLLACAVVDHQLPNSRYPFPHLTGAGVALKLAQACYSTRGRELPAGLFTLAALGTIADVAPLVDENRSIVRRGMAEIRRDPPPGLRALIRSAGLSQGVVDTEEVAWSLSPRLNAPGRLDSAMSSYQLLVEESEEEAAILASALERWNRERQHLTLDSMSRAQDLLEQELQGDPPGPILLVEDASFLPGIIGLVAGRLAEKFYRPAVVVTTGPEVSRGSCRSIPEFDIGGALYKVEARGIRFLRHGGHTQAAGFTIATEELPELRKQLNEVAAEALGSQELRPGWDIDETVALGSLPRDTYQLMRGLAPFGKGNPVPVFLSTGVQVTNLRTMGSNGEHLRLKLKDQGVTWDAVAFRQGEAANVIGSGDSTIDVVYTIGIDRYGPEETLRLTVLDLRPSTE